MRMAQNRSVVADLPDEPVELIKRIRKLRWIGMYEEARRTRGRSQGLPAVRQAERGAGTVRHRLGKRRAGTEGLTAGIPRDRSVGRCNELMQEIATTMRTVALEPAVERIPDGASLMVGGFMGVGTPERVVDELVRQGKRDLTIIANDTARPGLGIGKLVTAKAVKKAIVTHIGLNPETQKQMMSGEMEVELVPQGTLIERIRAGGSGLGGILTRTGVGTVIEKDRQKIVVGGEEYFLETALRADFALVHAFLADYIGNLSYALTARNFNPVVAMAAETVIADADHIVPVGVISPDHVVTPAPIVDYLIAN